MRCTLANSYLQAMNPTSHGKHMMLASIRIDAQRHKSILKAQYSARIICGCRSLSR